MVAWAPALAMGVLVCVRARSRARRACAPARVHVWIAQPRRHRSGSPTPARPLTLPRTASPTGRRRRRRARGPPPRARWRSRRAAAAPQTRRPARQWPCWRCARRRCGARLPRACGGAVCVATKLMCRRSARGIFLEKPRSSAPVVNLRGAAALAGLNRRGAAHACAARPHTGASPVDCECRVARRERLGREPMLLRCLRQPRQKRSVCAPHRHRAERPPHVRLCAGDRHGGSCAAAPRFLDRPSRPRCSFPAAVSNVILARNSLRGSSVLYGRLLIQWFTTTHTVWLACLHVVCHPHARHRTMIQWASSESMPYAPLMPRTPI